MPLLLIRLPGHEITPTDSGRGAEAYLGKINDRYRCAVACGRSVHEGNAADSQTFVSEVQRLRTAVGIEHMVIAGDQGMISPKAIAARRLLFA